MKHRLRGITLVEILVVIAILLVLAAIISPHLGTARRSAQIQSSLGRLRQNYLAIKLYQSEQDANVTYGHYEDMGLPGFMDINHWSYGVGQPSYPRAMFLSACGPHHSNGALGFTYWFPGSRWPEQVALYQEDMILVSDLNCTDPGNDIYNPYDRTRALGVLLSGQLINRVRTGDSKRVEFFVNP